MSLLPVSKLLDSPIFFWNDIHLKELLEVILTIQTNFPTLRQNDVIDQSKFQPTPDQQTCDRIQWNADAVFRG